MKEIILKHIDTPFKIDKEFNTSEFTGSNDFAIEAVRYFVKYENECLIEFLKEKGYRPKNTIKYIKGLNYRLKKKGLEVVVIRPKRNLSMVAKNENIVNVVEEFAFNIQPIQEEVKTDTYTCIELGELEDITHNKLTDEELKAVCDYFHNDMTDYYKGLGNIHERAE